MDAKGQHVSSLPIMPELYCSENAFLSPRSPASSFSPASGFRIRSTYRR